MGTILLKNIHTLATFDEERRCLQDAWVLIRDQTIEAVGVRGSEPTDAEQQFDLTDHVVLPGLINTHHHLFQSQVRNIPSLLEAPLFDWLDGTFHLMGEMTDEDVYVAAQVSLADLLLSGCTTTADHHYIRVNDIKADTVIRAAQEMGVRLHLARGSLSLGKRDGALPLDHMIETEEDILADCERLVTTYHDASPGAMVRVDFAPSSLYTSRLEVMEKSVRLARQYETGSHLHLAVDKEEVEFAHEKYGKRPVELAAEIGYVGPDVLFIHATQLDEQDMDILASTGTAISHCPNSNMLLANGCCPVKRLLQKGVPVSLGVDGSAANNACNVLDEVRNALLLQRVFYGANALAATQALEIATLGGAQALRRNDIGAIAPGMAADVIGIDLRRLSFAGGRHDPIAALVLSEAGHVDLSIVNGQPRVVGGQLVGIDLPALVKRQNELAAALVRRAEKRYNRSFSTSHWRRAFPYEEVI